MTKVVYDYSGKKAPAKPRIDGMTEFLTDEDTAFPWVDGKTGQPVVMPKDVKGDDSGS